ncbi:ABC transporter family substrate-binding protein [soil metagenome]
MAIVAAGALALTACTSGSGSGGGGGGDDDGSGGGTTDDSGEGSDDKADGPGRADMGDVTTKDDSISFSSGEQEWEAFNTNKPGTNSTYNSTVVGQLLTNFWYYGTDGAAVRNEVFGTYEKTSDDPLTVEYTISDDAVWEDGTPITSTDFLLDWASTNPDSVFGEEEAPFDSIGTLSDQVPEAPETEVGSKTFTYVYPEPYPDWEYSATAPLPAHVAAEQAGMEPDALAQAIIDGDAAALAPVAEFWNDGWLFADKTLPDPALVPSSGPYTLTGATWNSPQFLTIVPNENYWGPPPATANLVFRFAAPETHVQALQNGDINVIEPQATVDTVKQIEGMGEGFALESYDQLTWEHLDPNFAPDSPFSEEKGGLAAREAFAMCVPRQQIVDNLIQPINPEAQVLNARETYPFQDNYQDIVSDVYPGGYDEVDIEGAMAKLEESGLSTPVDVQIGYSAPNQRRTEEVTAIKASCDQAGFNIQDAGSADFFDDGGALDTGDYEVALFAWAGSANVTGASFSYKSDGEGNYGGFDNPQLDEAWNKIESTIDQAEIEEQLKIVEQVAWENLYTIPLFVHPGVVAYDATIENIRPTAAQTGVTWNADQWVRSE